MMGWGITTPCRTATRGSSQKTLDIWRPSGTPRSYSWLLWPCRQQQRRFTGGRMEAPRVRVGVCSPVLWWTVSSILDLLTCCFWSVGVASNLQGSKVRQSICIAPYINKWKCLTWQDGKEWKDFPKNVECSKPRQMEMFFRIWKNISNPRSSSCLKIASLTWNRFSVEQKIFLYDFGKLQSCTAWWIVGALWVLWSEPGGVIHAVLYCYELKKWEYCFMCSNFTLRFFVKVVHFCSLCKVWLLQRKEENMNKSVHEKNFPSVRLTNRLINQHVLCSFIINIYGKNQKTIKYYSRFFFT